MSDFSKPTISAVQPEIKKTPVSLKSNSLLAQDQLVEALGELETILNTIENLKKKAHTSEEWRVLMLYVATIKTRISTLAAFAKRVYAEDFGTAYDDQFVLAEGEKPPTARAAEIKARKHAGLSYEVSERFEKTWKDLDGLIWACKDIAASLDADQNQAAMFNAYPDHMFESLSDLENVFDNNVE